MDTGSTFSEWRDRVLLRSLQVHQRWRSRWHPRFRRLFPGQSQNLLTNAEVNVTLSHDAPDSIDLVDGDLPSDDKKEISMPDNNGENNKEADPNITVLAPIKDGDDKTSDTKSVEGMNVQSSPASKRGCSEHSQSQDSIAGESNYSSVVIEPVVLTTDAGETIPLTNLGTLDGCSSRATGSMLGAEGPLIRVIPPSLVLNVRPEPGASAARKSPVTVQEWVDSLPPPRLREDNTSEPWPPARPAGGLVREPSVQSDAGSHCSSVESLLGSRRADPEQILMGLGFGGAGNDCDSDVSRIPRRFLRPSKVKGVVIDDFLKHQHDLVQTFESGFYGYRGLTGYGCRSTVSTPAFSVSCEIPPRFTRRPPSTPRRQDLPSPYRRHLSVSQRKWRRGSDPVVLDLDLT